MTTRARHVEVQILATNMMKLNIVGTRLPGAAAQSKGRRTRPRPIMRMRIDELWNGQRICAHELRTQVPLNS